MNKNIVTVEHIQSMIDSSEVVISKVLNKTIVVSIKLVSGFEIIESATCLDQESYDEQKGIDVCFQKIGDKLFELEGYRVMHLQVGEKEDRSQEKKPTHYMNGDKI